MKALDAKPLKQEPMENSSSCLLELLATIATQALANDPALKAIPSAEEVQDLGNTTRITEKPSFDHTCFDLPKISEMAPTTLLRLFSLASFDAINRCFVYSCQMVEHCGWETRSYGNEMRAQNAMKEHLKTHVNHLIREGRPVELTSVMIGDTTIFKEPFTTIVKEERSEMASVEDHSHSQKSTSVVQLDHSYSLINMKYDKKMAKQEALPSDDYEDDCTDDETEEYSLAKLCKIHLNQRVDDDSTSEEFCRTKMSSRETKYGGYLVPESSSTPLIGSELELLTSLCCRREMSEPLRSKELNVYQEGHSDSKLLHEAGCEDSHLTVSYKREEAVVVPMDEDEERQLAVEAIANLDKGLKSHQCHLCTPNKHFSSYNTLLSHLRSHAGFRPYTCSICNTSFTRQHSLDYHMLIHRNESRFTCEFCGKAFRHPTHFKQHIRSAHSQEASFECSECMISFKTRVAFKKHLKTAHNQVLSTTGVLVHVDLKKKERFPQHITSKGIRQVKKEVLVKENVNGLPHPRRHGGIKLSSIDLGKIKQEPSDSKVLLRTNQSVNNRSRSFEKQNRVVATNNTQTSKHKQAFLAKLNGRPVLLIPKEEGHAKTTIQQTSRMSLANNEHSQLMLKEV